jgi:hypothetical protein
MARRLVLFVVLTLLAAACRFVPAPNEVQQTGTGSPATDLDKLHRIGDETANAAGVSVAGKSLDKPDYCQRPSDGSAGQGARMTYSIALNGATAEEASRRIAMLWKQKGNEWFGADTKFDDSYIADKGNRVHLYGGGWGISAEVPLNGTDGSYELLATGPCY